MFVIVHYRTSLRHSAVAFFRRFFLRRAAVSVREFPFLAISYFGFRARVISGVIFCACNVFSLLECFRARSKFLSGENSFLAKMSRCSDLLDCVAAPVEAQLIWLRQQAMEAYGRRRPGETPVARRLRQLNILEAWRSMEMPSTLSSSTVGKGFFIPTGEQPPWT